VALSDSKDVVPAFDSSGAITLPAARLKLDIAYPHGKKERCELTVVYRVRLYIPFGKAWYPTTCAVSPNVRPMSFSCCETSSGDRSSACGSGWGRRFLGTCNITQFAQNPLAGISAVAAFSCTCILSETANQPKLDISGQNGYFCKFLAFACQLLIRA
jgi:hypothetical protein